MCCHTEFKQTAITFAFTRVENIRLIVNHKSMFVIAIIEMTNCVSQFFVNVVGHIAICTTRMGNVLSYGLQTDRDYFRFHSYR